MSKVNMAVAARADVGLARTANEDAFVIADLDEAPPADAAAGLPAPPPSTARDVTEARVLLAISDGMGGHAAGEVASALVLETLIAGLRPAWAQPIEQVLDAAVRSANVAVVEAAKQQGKHGMGATLTAVIVGGTQAWIAEVGDSRAYLLRGGRLRQVTRDQSLVQMLVDSNVLTPEQAKTSPQKNVILQAMGHAGKIKVAIGRLELRRGDRLMLCCDGLSNAITDSELGEIIGAHDPQATCDRLIELANERGGEDNLTAIVAHFDGDGLGARRADESVTATFDILQEFAELPSAKKGEPVAPAPTAAPAPRRAPPPVEDPGWRGNPVIVVLVLMAAIAAVASLLLFA